MNTKRTPYVLSTVFFALLLIALSQPTLAQMSGMGGMGGMGGSSRGHRSTPSESGERSANSSNSNLKENELRRFTELEEKLHLSEAQRPLWERFADRLSAFNADLARNPSGAVIAKDNALQQIERKVDVIRNRLTALEEISDAANALYRGLSPEQKKEADALLASTIPGLYDHFQAPNVGRPSEGNKTDRRGQGDEKPEMPSR